MGADGRSDGVIGPLLGYRFGDGLEFCVVPLAGAAIEEAGAVFAGVGVLAFIWSAAGEVHGNGRVAAFGPELDPLAECGSAAAMNQNHRGEVCVFGVVACERAGCAVISKHAGWLSVIGLA